MVRGRPGILLTLGWLCLALLSWPMSTIGAEPAATPAHTDALTFTPELTIPGLLSGTWTISPTTIAEYIRVIFVTFVWAVGILATVMVVYGGIRWVAAAGNPGRINDARSIINNALIGVLIALSSLVLLNIINPNLTSFQGINLKTIDKELEEFLTDLSSTAGQIPRCAKSSVAGEPSKVCSGKTTSNPGSGVDYGCQDLNLLSNTTALQSGFNGIDPFAIKAIVTIESPKHDGSPYSGPEGKTMPDGSAGPGYGIGQFKIDTLREVLRKVNGGLPPGCRDTVVNGRRENLDPDGFHISQSCKDWLDKRTRGAAGTGISGLEAQVGMIAYYYGQQLSDTKCIKLNLALAAAAYNQGRGGASDAFCSTTYIRDPARREVVKARALEYIRRFSQAYAQACSSGV